MNQLPGYLSEAHDDLGTARKPTNMHYITTIYGDHLTGFIVPMLYSIRGKGTASVYYTDWPHAKEVKDMFPEVEFVETNTHISEGSSDKKISQSQKLWVEALRHTSHETVCIMDCDTIVLKPIDDIDFTADITFTIRDGVWPINSGVVVVKKSQRTIKFMEEWERESTKITNDEELLRIATTKAEPYGGGSQMAFHQMIKYKKGKNNYRHICKLQAMPCDVLNHCEDKPLTANTRIVHYKGHLQSVLLRAHPPREAEREKIELLKEYVGLSGGNLYGLKFPDQSTVSVSMIVRNSSDVLERCLESVKGADEIVIVDTGSEDNTMEIAKRYTEKVYEYWGCNEGGKKDGLFANFADARNKALSYCTSTHILTIDADEYLEEGGMAKLKNFTGTALSIRCLSEKTGEEHRQPRLYKNHPDIYWKGAAHNYLPLLGSQMSDITIYYSKNNQKKKDPDRTMRILRSEVKKHGGAREMYYLAKEYHRRSWWKKALKMYRRYVVKSKFNSEKADAFLQMARCYSALGRVPQAVNSIMASININPQCAEALRTAGELSDDIGRLKYKHLATKATNEGVLFIRHDNRIKVTVLSRKDWAGSGFRIVEQVREASQGKIDIEALTLFQDQGSTKWAMRAGVAIDDVGWQVAQARIDQSDIVLYKDDAPFQREFYDLKIPDHVKIARLVSGSEFRKNIGNAGQYTCDYNAYISKDLHVDGWEFMPNPYNRFDYSWKPGKKFRIVHIPSDPVKKGTLDIQEAIRKLGRDDVEFICKWGISHKESLELKKSAHIYIDQLLLPPVGNSAYEAMGFGVPVISYTGGTDDIIINTTTESLVGTINEWLDWKKLEKESVRQFEAVKDRCGDMGNKWIEVFFKLHGL